MKSQPKTISISPELAARCERPDAAERMDKLFRAVLKVPRSAVLEDIQERKRTRAKRLAAKLAAMPVPTAQSVSKPQTKTPK